MRTQRFMAMVVGFGLVAVAGCSSSGGSSGGASTTAAATTAAPAGSSSTPSTVARTPATTVAALSAAGSAAATALTDGSGFPADQSACMVSVVVQRVGETDGLPLFGSSSAVPTTAQEDALVAAFEGCLTPEDLGGLVGVTFQALASQIGGELTREQLVCAGRGLIDANDLRSLLFDQELLPKVFADKAAVTSVLTPCVPAALADALATAAVQVAAENAAAGASTTAAASPSTSAP